MQMMVLKELTELLFDCINPMSSSSTIFRR